MDNLLQDLRYAVRSLLRQPSFALTAIFTLALGIGATTAMFGVLNAIVLRPLPLPDAGRIVAVANFWTKSGVRSVAVSAPDFEDWKARGKSFATLAYYTGGETSVTIGPSGTYVTVYRVTPGFFETLGASTTLGRLLSADELAPGGPLAVVITDAFWRKQFNRDPAAVGTSVKFGDRFFPIVGVLSPGIRYPMRAEIYGPAAITPPTVSRSGHNYRVIGRLNDGVSAAQASAEMVAIARQLEAEYPTSNSGKSAVVVPLQELIVGDTRHTLYILLAAVGLVLLIACANVANLLLARATAREREMVVRAAVGAGRLRLIQQLLTESALLAVLSALCGLWLARLGVVALVALAPADLPRIDEIRVDGTVLTFALFGLAPALQVSRVHLVDGLRQGGKGSSIGARGAWARSVFVVAEVALAVVLVFGAGLLARSLIALAAVDMGFAPDRLLVVHTAVPIRGMPDAPRATAFYRDLLADVRALPGVASVGAVTSLPTAIRSNGGYSIEGRPTLAQTGIRSPQALFTVTTPDYFRTLRVPFRSGRDFNDGDRRDAPFVAIINESLARASFAGQDPIGQRIQCGLDSPEYMTIVGIVADVRTDGPSRPALPELYMPYEQHPGPASSLNIVARTEAADPLALAETIGRKIRERNRDVPVRATTMAGTLETAAAAPRFRTFLLVTFAAVALLLALAGVYGVMAYSVSQRLPELGVRVALGATPRSIMGLVLGQGAKLGAAGLVLGLGLSLLAGRLLQNFLFSVTPRDPVLLALVTVSVAVATLVACCIPGRRAVRVDPMVALRAE
jgi:putative ABC transport system permease protein